MDRYAEIRATLFRAVFDGPASLDRATRAAIGTEKNVPVVLRTLVAKIHRHAYRVTDEDIRELLAHGYTEDQIFEVIVSASVGASRERFEAAIRAVNASTASGADSVATEGGEHASASR